MSTANELLRRALETWENSTSFITDWAKLHEDIRTFLAAEPEAEPFGRLKADLSPPSGKGPFTNVDDLMKALREDDEKKAEPVACVNTPLSMVYPEYNRRVLGARPEPAIRKPMTEEEIDEEIATNEHYCKRSFGEGVRWAEKHHGITE